MKRTTTVLIVDDDREIRELIRSGRCRRITSTF